MINERRKFKRANTSINLFYKIMGVKGEVSLWTVDLSGGGLRLRLQESAQVNSIVEMGLSIPPGTPVFFSLGRIAWQRRYPEDLKEPLQYYDTGIEFIKMDVDNRAKVVKFVHKKLKEAGDES